MTVDVGNPFSKPFASLVDSLQDSLLLGVEQPDTAQLLYRSGTAAYPLRGVGPVSGLADQVTGFIAGKPAVFNLGQHYRYAVGQLVWQPLDTSDPALAAGWFPDDNSRLTVGYFYRDLPSGITDFNAGSVAGTLVRAVSRELKLLYEQMDQAYRRAFIDFAQGVALDNVVALLGITRNPALPAQGEVTFSLKKAPKNDVVIPVGTRVADARGRVFKVTAASVVPAVLVENFTAPTTAALHASQPVAAVVQVQLRGASGNLATVDTAPGKPFGDDGQTVTLAALPAPGSTIVLRYLSKAPRVTVPVVAADDGPEGNLGSGSLTVMPTPPRGVDGGVTNALPTSGGEAAEADGPLRERAKHALERAGNATLNAIRFAVLNVDGVDSVEVRDFSVDPLIPLGEVLVRFATGKPEIEAAVVDVVDKTRAAGIRARVTQVKSVTVSGVLFVIPDVAGGGKDAYARYKAAVLKAIGALGIGGAVSARKLASLVFQVPGLADVGDVELNVRRAGDPSAAPIASDPFLLSAEEQARPDDGAISVVPLQTLAPSAATLTGGGHTLSCTLRLLDDTGTPVTLRKLQLALTASVRGKPTATPNQPLAQVAQTGGSVTFTNADHAVATFDAVNLPGLAGLDATTLEVLVQAAAYPGLHGGSTLLPQA